jgi:hypothetical protein
MRWKLLGFCVFCFLIAICLCIHSMTSMFSMNNMDAVEYGIAYEQGLIISVVANTAWCFAFALIFYRIYKD